MSYHLLTGDDRALQMVDLTLSRMAAGGIYDQLGGGFHRYATDDEWLVPHFEKMLYDNALLVRVYLHAWQLTRQPLYRRVVEETLSYLSRELSAPTGGFYSAQDADSEGQEGKYYLWGQAEVQAVLGEDVGALVSGCYGIGTDGDHDGADILHVTCDWLERAEQIGWDKITLRQTLDSARAALLHRREQRAAPDLDVNVITAWNGLAVSAFAEAGRVLKRADWIKIAQETARFLLDHVRNHGRLLRSWHAKSDARHNAYLEDYAFLADGLLTLYESTFEVQWFEAAQGLVSTVSSLFEDPAGGFFDTSDDHERLIVRPKQLQDTVIPSGNSSMVSVLQRMAAYGGSVDDVTVAVGFSRQSRQMLASIQSLAAKQPRGFGHWLSGMAFELASPVEIALIGERQSSAMKRMLAVVFENYRPFQVVAAAVPRGGADKIMPLLHNRPQLDGLDTAYVCRNSVCQEPLTDADVLLARLETDVYLDRGETDDEG